MTGVFCIPGFFSATTANICGSNPDRVRQSAEKPPLWLPLGGKLSPEVTDEGATLYPTEG